MFEHSCAECVYCALAGNETPCNWCSIINILKDNFVSAKETKLQQDIDSIKTGDFLAIKTEYEVHKVFVLSKYNIGILVYAYGEEIYVPYKIIQEVKWL
jgi:hypothetical protein